MARPASLGKMSYAEYLALEARADTRHEYLDGEVFAMAGGTPEHGALAMAVARALGVALRGRPCRVFSSDVRVRIPETGLTTYPDLSVVCSKLETDPIDPDAITNPLLIVEVLSDTTEGYDRGGGMGRSRGVGANLGVPVGVTVGVTVGVAVGVPTGPACTSNEPVSIRPSLTRSKPGPR